VAVWQIIARPDFPVVLTSLIDDAVGAGFSDTRRTRQRLEHRHNGVVFSINAPPWRGEPVTAWLPISQEFADFRIFEADLGRDGNSRYPVCRNIIDKLTFPNRKPSPVIWKRRSITAGGLERLR